MDGGRERGKEGGIVEEMILANLKYFTPTVKCLFTVFDKLAPHYYLHDLTKYRSTKLPVKVLESLPCIL